MCHEDLCLHEGELRMYEAEYKCGKCAAKIMKSEAVQILSPLSLLLESDITFR